MRYNLFILITAIISFSAGTSYKHKNKIDKKDCQPSFIHVSSVNIIADNTIKFIKNYQPISANQKPVLYEYFDKLIDDGIKLEDYQYSILLSLIASNKQRYSAFDDSLLKKAIKENNYHGVIYHWLEFNIIDGKPNCKALNRRIHELLGFYNITEETINDSTKKEIHSILQLNLDNNFNSICYK